MSFSQLGLSDELLTAIASQGYQVPTPIQRQAIPVILEHQDVLAGAQTGTGKTAGFTLPLLQLLNTQTVTQKPRPIRALILTPTRELALQVYESVCVYGQNLPLWAEVVHGGVSINNQIKRLHRGTDILVATPGRLLDLVQQQQIYLGKVEFFVLDEADRMLDMGFIHDMRKIIALLPKKRQTLMFSATFETEVKALAQQLLNNPVSIEVTPANSAADTVSQKVYPIEREYKRELLAYLIGHHRWSQVLVFVRTKHGADRLCKQLQLDGIRCAALHGNKSQSARNTALESFKNNSITVLVATDIAARGLDIDQLGQVVNFDLPAVAEDYVHRIGRTGRAGAVGAAISLVCPDEAHLLAAIEKLLQKKIPQVADTGYAKVSLSQTINPKKAVSSRPHNKPGFKTSAPAKKQRAETEPRKPRRFGRIPAKKG